MSKRSARALPIGLTLLRIACSYKTPSLSLLPQGCRRLGRGGLKGANHEWQRPK
jgi:hypothetical protein